MLSYMDVTMSKIACVVDLFGRKPYWFGTRTENIQKTKKADRRLWITFSKTFENDDNKDMGR